MARQPFLMGNWKMYKTVPEAIAFAEELANQGPLPSGVEYAVAGPFTALYALSSKLSAQVTLGAQNVHFEPQGAYTGEVSIAMLKDVGVTYVILGHSERRHIFGESDAWVGQKVQAVVGAGLTPVLCVGENLEQKEAGQTLQVCEQQTVAGLAALTAEQTAAAVIAYEPVWAIGSGLTPTTADAEAVIAAIRQVVEREKGALAAASIRILYGGSVKPDNIASFMAEPNIDGALVGGASLEVGSFRKLAIALAGKE